MKDNLILIGMPACGKSTIGVLLAKTAGKAFVDTDLLIQEDQHALLQDIIDRKGNTYFQQMERQILTGIHPSNAVIATGGSAVYYEDAMTHLQKIGIIIYLKLSLASIEKRLNNIGTRGVLMSPGETLIDLYQRRTPLYEKYADITISADNLSTEQVVEETWAAYNIY